MTSTPPTPSDEWIEHDGGQCPVELETIVEIWRRDGIGGKWEAGFIGWENTGGRHDIIAYRKVNPK